MKGSFRIACVVSVLLCTAALAQAQVYKNPAHGLTATDQTGGVIFQTISRDLTSGAIDGTVGSSTQILMGTYGFGIGPHSVLELHGGLMSGALENQDAATGYIYGAAYRQDLSEGARHQGLFAAYHGGYTGNDTSDTWVSRFDGGYAMAYSIAPDVMAYGGAVISSLEGTIDIFGVGAYDFEGAGLFGLFVGAELASSPTLRMGLELHIVHENAFGFYVEGRF